MKAALVASLNRSRFKAQSGPQTSASSVEPSASAPAGPQSSGSSCDLLRLVATPLHTPPPESHL